MPYNGEFHFTALRTLGSVRTMRASSRRPRSRFQPDIAAMYACTGASPSAFAICGLPPERRTTFSPFRTLIGLAFAPAFGGDLDFGGGVVPDRSPPDSPRPRPGSRPLKTQHRAPLP